MRLSTKGRYAVTAMMDLALHERGGPVPLSDISACQSISLSYLEQLFAKLRRHGLVKSVRGVHGGYLLARPATEIPIAEIFGAVDEKVETRLVTPDGEGPRDEAEELQELWNGLSRRLYDFLNNISLHECINTRQVQEIAETQDMRQGRERPLGMAGEEPR